MRPTDRIFQDELINQRAGETSRIRENGVVKCDLQAILQISFATICKEC
jgi:hypothetical protein